MELLYKGSEDGFKAENFHQKCDGKGATLTLVSTADGYVFGGFTTRSFQSPEKWERISDGEAFCFSLSHC